MNFERDYQTFRNTFIEFLNGNSGFDYRSYSLDEIVKMFPFSVYENCSLFNWVLKASQLIIGESFQEDTLKLLDSVSEIVSAKNKDYGNSALTIPMLAPNVPVYQAILCRMSDKIERYINLSENSNPEVAESITDTLKDFIGYSILLWIHVFVDGDIDTKNDLVLYAPVGMKFCDILKAIDDKDFVLIQTSAE